MSGDESEMIYLIVLSIAAALSMVVCLISTHVKRRTSSCRFIARSSLRSKRKTNCTTFSVFQASLLGYTRFQSSGQVCGKTQAPRLLPDIFPSDFLLPPSKNSDLLLHCAANVVHNGNVCSTSRIRNVNTFSCFSQIKTFAFDKEILGNPFPFAAGEKK